MPAFHTHWVVALQAISQAPGYIRAGFTAYKGIVADFRNDCCRAIAALATQSNGAQPDLEAAFKSAQSAWERAIAHKDVELRGSITCFSAYMLGACGPDFWTLPSEPKRLWLVPRMASIHFDLGHYNRTHRQFELSIAEVGGPSKVDLQAMAQRSYFLGMATHIAADLIVHQLVNVTAGAYNLLEHKDDVPWFGKTWVNEHGGAYDMRLWNTHNKVEHFWDSFVRYRYLGDLHPFWPPTPQSQAASGSTEAQHGTFPLNFPTIEGLEREAARWGVLQRCAKFLQKEETRFSVEKPLTFPWLFCDRVLAGQLQPFIYRIVVDKTNGSYRANELAGKFREKATDEANDDQMKADSPVPSERQNLAFFSSQRNTDDGSTSFNFLNFKVCPNVERTRRFAANTFYDFAALLPFLNTAAVAATTLVGELSSAYADGSVAPLKKLRGFWNLDTGLGLRVSQRKSTTDRESITELEFKHVFRELGTGNPRYVRGEPYLAGHKSGNYSFPGTRAFQTYPHDAFESIESVYEERDSAYLEEVKVAERTGGDGDASMVQSSTLKEENRLVLRDIKQRLTLRLRASIADLKTTQASQKDSSCEDLALFFLGDKAGKPGKAASEETREWLAKESKILDYRDQPKDVDKGLQSFETRLLVNTEEEDLSDAKAEMRQIGKGIWNNVVPYGKHEGDYGRNFAIGTGRKHVLHSIDGGTFDPVNSLACYDNISPTEHVFFTLYALVRTGRSCWDIFAKKAVPDSELNEMLKISSLGTVKILLIYERQSDDTLSLCDCFIDGLRLRVET